MTPLPEGLLVLLVLAMPIATIAWTVTHEEIFKEPREYFVRKSEQAPGHPDPEDVLRLHL